LARSLAASAIEEAAAAEATAGAARDSMNRSTTGYRGNATPGPQEGMEKRRGI